MEEKNKKQGKGKIITIIILILLVLGLSGFIVYDKVLYKYFEKKEVKEENESKEEKPIGLDVNSEEVDAIMGKVAVFNLGESLFENDKFNIQSLTDENIVEAAIGFCSSGFTIDYEIEKDIKNGDLSKYKICSLDEVNKNLSKYVYNKKITLEDIRQFNKREQIIVGDYVIYIVEDNLIVLEEPQWSTGRTPYMLSRIIKAEKTSEKIEIYEKVVFADYNSEFDTVNYCSDINRKNKIQSIKIETDSDGSYLTGNYEKELDKLNLDLFNTYKYIFINHNGNYYFDSLELVK